MSIYTSPWTWGNFSSLAKINQEPFEFMSSIGSPLACHTVWDDKSSILKWDHCEQWSTLAMMAWHVTSWTGPGLVMSTSDESTYKKRKEKSKTPLNAQLRRLLSIVASSHQRHFSEWEQESYEWYGATITAISLISQTFASTFKVTLCNLHNNFHCRT